MAAKLASYIESMVFAWISLIGSNELWCIDSISSEYMTNWSRCFKTWNPILKDAWIVTIVVNNKLWRLASCDITIIYWMNEKFKIRVFKNIFFISKLKKNLFLLLIGQSIHKIIDTTYLRDDCIMIDYNRSVVIEGVYKLKL